MENIQTITDRLQADLATRMMDAFDWVINERKAHYMGSDAESADSTEVKRIVSRYVQMNTGISGAMGLVPGPLGLLAVAPEIGLVVRNQLAMICDVAEANGKEDFLNRELLAGVFATSAGLGGVGLITMHGGKVLVKRASLRVFQKVVHLLAGNLTQKTIKAALGKWVPVAGAVTMAALSGISTHQLGRRADEIFGKTIEIVDDEPIDAVADSASADVPAELAVIKATVLINLMKRDGRIRREERASIEGLIASAGFGQAESDRLRAQIRAKDPVAADVAPFLQHPDEALGLLTEMVALAMADGDTSDREVRYIKQVARQLSLDDSDVDSMLALDVAKAQ